MKPSSSRDRPGQLISCASVVFEMGAVEKAGVGGRGKEWVGAVFEYVMMHGIAIEYGL